MGARASVRRHGPLTEEQQVVDDMTSQGSTIACFGLAVLLASIIVVAVKGPSETRVGGCIALGFSWVMLLTSFVSLRIQRALRMIPKPPPPPPPAPAWKMCKICAHSFEQHQATDSMPPQDPYVDLARLYEAGSISLDRYTELLSRLAGSESGPPSPPSP